MIKNIYKYIFAILILTIYSNKCQAEFKIDYSRGIVEIQEYSGAYSYPFCDNNVTQDIQNLICDNIQPGTISKGITTGLSCANSLILQEYGNEYIQFGISMGNMQYDNGDDCSIQNEVTLQDCLEDNYGIYFLQNDYSCNIQNCFSINCSNETNENYEVPTSGTENELFLSGDYLLIYKDNQWHFTCYNTDSFYDDDDNGSTICSELGYFSYEESSAIECDYTNYPTVSKKKKYSITSCYDSDLISCSIFDCSKESSCQKIVCNDTPFFFTTGGFIILIGIIVFLSIICCCVYNYRHNSQIKQRLVIVRQRRQQQIKKQQEELEQQRKLLEQNQQIQPFGNMMFQPMQMPMQMQMQPMQMQMPMQQQQYQQQQQYLTDEQKAQQMNLQQ